MPRENIQYPETLMIDLERRGLLDRPPSRTMTACFAEVRASPPSEQLLDIGELQFDIGRAAVVALAGVRRVFHLAQQRVHLLRLEAAAGPHRAVAGHGGR